MKVTVFGGARPRPGDPAYKEAYLLGTLLGKAGYSILTGGYCGTMEATSHGAADAGVHVIGVTCDEIENYRSTRPNKWIEEEWRCKTLRERLWTLIENCDAAIALPGGAGTLAEITLLWNHLLIGAIQPRALILVGKEWKEIFSLLFDHQSENFSVQDQDWILFAKDVQDAVHLLQKYPYTSANPPKNSLEG
ncbi:MAG: LOG family protein [Anaerolineaceae bacterium]|nr:LOG family protein [Anaerolineaceae bacterium]